MNRSITNQAKNILVVEVIVILLINHLHCRGGEKAFIHDAGMSVFNFCDL